MVAPAVPRRRPSPRLASRQRLVGGLVAALALAGMVGAWAGRPGQGGPILRVVAFDHPIGALAVDPTTGRAFVLTLGAGDAPSRVTMLDARTGAPLRTVAVGVVAGGGTAALDVDARGGRVAAAAANDAGGGTVAVLDARTGAVLRRMRTLTSPIDVALDVRRGRVVVAGMGAQIGAALRDSGVDVRDALTGDRVRAGRAGVALAVAVDRRAGRVVAVSQALSGVGGTVAALDVRTGRPLWSVARRARATPHGVSVDERTGRALVAEDDGVAVLDTRTGRVLRIVQVGGPPLSIVADPSRHRAFVTVPGQAGMSRLVVLDSRDERPLHTVPLPANVVATALDARRGRLVVTSVGAGGGAGGETGRASRAAWAGTLTVLDVRGGSVRRGRAITLPGIVGDTVIDEGTGYLVVISTPGLGPPSDPRAWVPRWLQRWVPALRPATGPPPGGRVLLLDVAR